MRPSIVLLLFILFIDLGCQKDEYSFNPEYDKSYLANTVALPTELRTFLIGNYSSPNNNDGLGEKFVMLWKQNKLSIFSNRNGNYAVLDVGINYADSSIKMAGYWRSPLTQEEGKLYLTITKGNGASEILAKQFTVSKWLGQNITRDNKSSDIELVFERFFSNKVLANAKFSIIAHRAGGRNSDNIPFAENSIELVKRASEMGANGVEIDIKLTKDNVPIVYHDDDINIRLTQKGPVIGNIEDFNYEFLQRYVRLVDGQTIPTLEDMLNTIIDSTDIKFVWLDNKGGSERIFSYTLPIMYKAIQKAKGKNNDIIILNGIPTEEIATEFLKVQNSKDRPNLCEISFVRAKELNSVVYAPRWTLGTLDAEIAEAHSRNMKVVTWTVDLNTVMKKYISVGNFDGILTNYPSILAYEFYSQE
jgi:glycerophosphoryl diester phosphodiesterase